MRTTNIKKHLPGITVDPNVPDFSKSPFVIKKVERARAFIAKHGLPKDLDKPKKSKYPRLAPPSDAKAFGRAALFPHHIDQRTTSRLIDERLHIRHHPPI